MFLLLHSNSISVCLPFAADSRRCRSFHLKPRARDRTEKKKSQTHTRTESNGCVYMSVCLSLWCIHIIIYLKNVNNFSVVVAAASASVSMYVKYRRVQCYVFAARALSLSLSGELNEWQARDKNKIKKHQNNPPQKQIDEKKAHTHTHTLVGYSCRLIFIFRRYILILNPMRDDPVRCDLTQIDLDVV